MARTVKNYKGFVIKETSKKDNTTYKFWVLKPDWDPEAPVYEADNLQECVDFIDCY